jgi:hypothetical protein
MSRNKGRTEQLQEPFVSSAIVREKGRERIVCSEFFVIDLDLARKRFIRERMFHLLIHKERKPVVWCLDRRFGEEEDEGNLGLAPCCGLYCMTFSTSPILSP